MKLSERAEATFNNILRSALASLEFEQIRLKDCIHSEFLYRNGRIWFSLSWDWRDQYLDVSLGHLFWFKDVMPRVDVIGDFSHWDKSITWDAIRSELDFLTVFERIRDALPDAFSKLEGEYSIIFDEFRKSRSKNLKIDDYIGEEIDIDSLEKFRV